MGVKLYFDTNAAVWISGQETRQLMSRKALEAIASAEQLLISPMAVFEMKALHRKNKIGYTPAEIVMVLREQLGVEVCSIPFSTIVSGAMGIHWTTDPGDILITANAMVNGNAGLITSDRVIRANYDAAIW